MSNSPTTHTHTHAFYILMLMKLMGFWLLITSGISFSFTQIKITSTCWSPIRNMAALSSSATPLTGTCMLIVCSLFLSTTDSPQIYPNRVFCVFGNSLSITSNCSVRVHCPRCCSFYISKLYPVNCCYFPNTCSTRFCVYEEKVSMK